MTQDEYKKILENDKYLLERKNHSEPEIRLFLREVNFYCPLCHKELQSKNQKKIAEKKFHIAHIYPNRPTKEQIEVLFNLERLGENSESFENKIALCRDCHATQDFHTTKEEYIKLLNIKKKLLTQTSLKDVTNTLGLEIEIADVINAIPKISEDLSKLNYSPVKIAEKFYRNENLLKIKVESYVNNFFPYIRELFRAKEGKDNFLFSVLSSQIKSCFEKMSVVTQDKSLIYLNMVEWIKGKTGSVSTEACEAVISFFIQHCEVFNEITK